ncbi:proline-rich nuclear receptor coactivator 2-like [Bombus pascuorum]|uniref:proline-rich nuclear receptor coactivator 2-like n=1 Tax=Bombus pascuorum TaxID=65598 RepID=UPI002138C5D5|nr:proline-rich nuclear receptor coactivator 2-like [Bombus pascuorum]
MTGWLTLRVIGETKVYYKEAMTNSVPKMKNKVDRQCSPNVGVERYHHHRSSAIKSSTYFHNNGRFHGRNSTGRLSCSPHSLSKGSRNSPLRYEYSPRGSPTSSFYAGAKFSEPPSPASLPKPPSHWTKRLMSSCQQSDRSCDISNHLKMILNVQA